MMLVIMMMMVMTKMMMMIEHIAMLNFSVLWMLII